MSIVHISGSSKSCAAGRRQVSVQLDRSPGKYLRTTISRNSMRLLLTEEAREPYLRGYSSPQEAQIRTKCELDSCVFQWNRKLSQHVVCANIRRFSSQIRESARPMQAWRCTSFLD